MAMYDPARKLAHRTVGVTRFDTNWHLGEGFTGFGWETFLAVGNMSIFDSVVTATYHVDGEAPVVRQLTIPALSRGTFIGHGLVSGVGSGKAFSVSLNATWPVVVQEVLIDPSAGAGRANSTMAEYSLSRTWSFSGGSNTDGMVSFITVGNPSSGPEVVTATYYFDDGTPPATQQMEIPGHSRATFSSVAGIPQGKRFGVVVSSSSGSVIAQEAVYDEPRVRSFSAGGLAEP
jgi:hypothetical protein